MATFGNSLKVTGALAFSGGGAAPATLYTAPAGGYAIINVIMTAGTLAVATKSISTGTVGQTQSFVAYVGPSQVLATTAGANTYQISGVEFSNS